MDLIKRLKKLNKERFEIILQLAPEVEEALKRLEFPPKIDSIGWAQYTPYNSDDFCVYCDVDSLFINGEDINDSEFSCRLSRTEYKKNPLTGKYELDINLNYGDYSPT